MPPQRPGASRAFAPTLIAPTDDLIRALAVAEGAVLVDVYRDFNGQVDLLLGDDGLHPSAAGYQRMAGSFFTAISASLEVRASADARRFDHRVDAAANRPRADQPRDNAHR